MRKTILFIASILLFGGVFAQNVPFQDAQRAAEGLFASQQKRLSHCVDVAVSGNDTLYYVFNAENGFAVIAADRRVPPVLAFSDREPFRPGEVIPPVKMWLDHYRTQLAELKAQPAGLQAEHSAWARLARGSRPLRDGQHFVEPLVRSHWGQGKFYNYYCPQDFSGENNHVVTGCVATAMAQLIYYFRFPETGIGSYSYTDENYGVQSADYGATHYNYDAMCDEPTAINADICTLMHHCGVGVDMVYGPDGSGMYNHSAARVLRTFFKYNPATEYLFRDSTQLDWDSVIVWHLERRIPMYYAGWSNPNINGHGFLCDGYQIVDSAYYYHFNFGWDGSYDNYFYTDQLNLIGTHFNLAQELIVNCYPDTAQYTYPTPQPTTGVKTMTALAGSFTDGSAEPDHCHPAMDYLWHIVPDADTLESITLDIQYTLAEGDTLWYYDIDKMYNHAIAGIGRDTLHWLDRVEGISAESALLKMRLLPATGSGRAELLPGQYLLWGESEGKLSFGAGSAFALLGDSIVLFDLMERAWLVRATNTAGLRTRISVAADSLPRTDSLYLLVDRSGKGVFDGAECHGPARADSSGQFNFAVCWDSDHSGTDLFTFACAGTPERLYHACCAVRNYQHSSETYAGSIEEAAFECGLIDRDRLRALYEELKPTAYGRHLAQLAD